MSYSLADIAKIVNAQVLGDPTVSIEGLATLSSAMPSHISFLANKNYVDQLASTRAGAVLVSEKFASDVKSNALVVDDPYYAFAKLTEVFDNAPQPSGAVHPTAVIADSAVIGANVSVGPQVVIGERVAIGEGSVIGANAAIGDDSKLGANCELKANVSIYHNCRLGDNVRLHSGVVIGADGFGFAPTSQGWQRIHQLGGVVIGDRVDIGANSTIDRGALDDTTIGNDVIIDNLVQIAHNVEIGDGTAIAAMAGIAGSAKIGKRCVIAGGVGIVGHIEICDGAQFTARTLVTKSITEPKSFSSGVPMSETREWKRNAVRFNQLNDMYKALKK